MIPKYKKYKKGDVVQYNDARDYNPPMIILESVKSDRVEANFFECLIMRGDEIYWVFESWVEPVK